MRAKFVQMFMSSEIPLRTSLLICYWKFSLTSSIQPHYGSGVDSASNRNEYQEYFLGVKTAGA